MVLRKATYVFLWNDLAGSFNFIVTMIIKISLSILNFLLNYSSSGQSFAMVLTLERSGSLQCGTTRRCV